MMLPKIFKFRKLESKIETSENENRTNHQRTLAELGIFMSEDEFKLKINQMKKTNVSV